MLTGWSTQPFTGCDTETTAPIPTQARLVTASTIIVAGQEKRARDWLADPGVEIPAEATAIHKITTEYARKYGKPAGEVAIEVAENLAASWAAGLPVIIYNAPYDLTVLHCELSWNWDTPHGLFTFGAIGHIIDPLVIDKHCDKYRPGSRKLVDTCRHYGITLTDAHSASADTLAAMRLAWKLARIYPEIGRMDLDELQVKQAQWYRESQLSFAGYLRDKIAPGAPVEERAGILLRAQQVEDSADEWPMKGIIMSRQEHLKWAKARALAELDADPQGNGPLNAIMSMVSDLRRHPDTEDHVGINLGTMMAMSGLLDTESQVRNHINGFQ